MVRLAGLLVLLTLAAAGTALWFQLDRPIATVEVTGHLNSDEQAQVRAALAQGLEGGLLSIDLERLRAPLAALSWPRNISIRRVWPDRIAVSLEKALVVAGWNDAYLTMGGEVVELAAAEENLVRFECELTRPQAALELYQRLQREVAPAELQIEELKENALGEWTLTFDNGIVLALGGTELDDRLQRFLTVYRAELRGRIGEIGRVDARYANGIAVSWEAVDASLALANRSGGIRIGDNYERSDHGF